MEIGMSHFPKTIITKFKSTTHTNLKLFRLKSKVIFV